MAFGTDFYVNVFLGRTSYKFITAVANDFGLIVIWVDTLFNDIHLYTVWYMTDTHVKITVPIEQLNQYSTEKAALQAFFLPRRG